MRGPIVIFLASMAIFIFFPLWSGAQWVQSASPNGGWITALVVSETNLFASTRDGGIFLSTDNGASWRAINSGLPKKADFQCLVVSGTNIFAGTVGRGVFLSTDNGTSWKAVNSGLPAKSSVWRLVVSGTNLFAVAGSKVASVFLSTDNGTSWTEVSSGLPDVEVLCLAVSGTNLFAGTLGGGVFLSTDNGTNWKAVSSGLPAEAAILRLEVSGTNLYAGTWGGGRVFLSTNNGSSWKAINSGLPDSMEFSLSDFAVSNTNLFLGSFRGVYISTNKGASWTAINSGLPAEPSIYCLTASGTNLYAGTEEGKVWRLPLSDISLAINLSAPVLSEQQMADIRKDYGNAVFIPKEIKAVMQEGLVTRQGRQDIPFTIFKYLLFPAKDSPHNIVLFSPSYTILIKLPPKSPAKDSFHAVIFFRAKNNDLGYAIRAPASDPEQRQQVAPGTASIHEAQLTVFIEFRQTDESGVSKVVREVYVPATFQQDSATFNPDKEEWYSVGYTLRPGKYTAVIAITPQDNRKKIGVGYFDIELPGPESYQTALKTTPVYFIHNLVQRKEPDFITLLHKGMFTWSKLLIVPEIDNVVSPGERLWIAFCLLGAKPKHVSGLKDYFSIETIYEVQEEDGTEVTKYIASVKPFAEIMQQIPLKQTIKIMDDKGEREEQRDLPTGRYFLVIKVKDKVSNATIEKKVPFEIK